MAQTLEPWPYLKTPVTVAAELSNHVGKYLHFDYVEVFSPQHQKLHVRAGHQRELLRDGWRAGRALAAARKISENTRFPEVIAAFENRKDPSCSLS